MTNVSESRLFGLLCFVSYVSVFFVFLLFYFLLNDLLFRII